MMRTASGAPRPPRRIGARVQMIVLRNLAHVIVEVPTARVLDIGDALQRTLHHHTLCIVGSGAVLAKDGHGHIARIAV